MSLPGDNPPDRSRGMPIPATFESPAQPPSAGEMPRPSTGEPARDTDVPRPTAAGAGTLPRFGPPGAGGPPAFEPGVVEVQFREGVTPTLTRAGGTAPVLAAADGAALDQMNQVLQRYGLVQAEPTFTTSRADTAAAQGAPAAPASDVPLLARFVTLHFPDDADTARIAAEVNALPEVERAVPVPIALPPTMTPERPGDVVAAPPANPLADPLVGTSSQVVVDPRTGLQNQWYLFRCHVNRAWSRSSGRTVVIGDVDWGFRTGHQDLATKITRTYNAVDGTADVTHGASVFHGTGVAGLTGAAANGLGMSGVGYEAEVWGIQADSGTGTNLGGNSWARGIDWVRTADSDGRRKVVILEVQTGAFGNFEQVPSVNAVIRTAIAAGVVVCVAAGNGNKDAGLDDSGNAIPETGSILVGATAYDPSIDKRAWFSNYGSRITVAAPGDGDHDVTCDSTGDAGYRNAFGGTSGATPKVAGVAALMLAVNPGLGHADVRRILNVTGSALTEDPGKPIGRFLDADAAVRQAADGAATP